MFIKNIDYECFSTYHQDMELTESLVSLGLNDKEAKVFLALLPLEKATAYAVAVRSGLKKPTAYVVLNNLVGKGFALKIPSSDKHLFMAKSPKECVAIARQRLSIAEDALPELMALRKKGEEKANVSYFEGFDGIREMYARLVSDLKWKPADERSFVAFYAHQKHTPEFLREYWLELNETYRANKIRRQAVTTLDPSIREYLKEETKRRFGMDLRPLPESEYSSNISIEIYGNCVQIVSHRGIQGVLIEHPDIADVMRQIFALAWKTTE